MRVKNLFKNRICFLIIPLIVIAGFSGCSQKQLLAKDSFSQHYVDVTKKYLPSISGTIRAAQFAIVNNDPFRDLILHQVNRENASKILLLINKNKRGFEFPRENKVVKTEKGDILFFSAGDFNRDHADDLILIQKAGGNTFASLLFNNKKGYYYKKIDYVLPEIRQGVERVQVVDLDHDGDLDLYFYGKRVLNPDGRPDRLQAQAFINNGKGEFQDLSDLLLPPLPPGIVGAFFADYDGDEVRDIFLLYGNASNRLLLNNSLGKFSDKTAGNLPYIKDETVHGDWADFDGDGDNDFLVINRRIASKNRAHSKETCYFLENDGKGRFTKRSHKILPKTSVSRVYLLDANGNGIPDMLILSGGKTNYFQGQGEWKFSVETVKRLPRSRWFIEMAFGDIDDDGYLDIFGIDPKRKGRLWLNRFK
jgi:VCBS repeat protein